MQPQQEKRPGLGSAFSSALGEGLGQSLLSSVTQQMQQSAVDRALGQLKPGMSPEQMMQVGAQLPPEQQQLFLKGYLPMVQQQQEQEQQQQMSQMKQRQEQQQSSALDNILGGMLTQEEEEETGGIISSVSPEKQQRDASEKESIMSELSKLPLAEKKFAIQQLQEKKKEEREETKTALQETKDYRKKVLDDYKDYRSTNMRLERMKKLNKEGDMDTPIFGAMMSKLGFSSFLTPDTQEFDKLSKDLLKNIRTFFGARINQIEVENFLKTIPTLSQSPEGRERVIENLQKLSEGQKVYYDTYKEIMKGRKNPPLNLEEMVLEKSDDKLDAIAEDFVGGFKQPGPEEEVAMVPGIEEAPIATQEVTPEKKEKLSYSEWIKSRQGKPPPEAGRQIVRSLSRAAETVAGIPGDVAELAASLPSEKMPGLKRLQEAGESFRKVFPTSGELKDFSEKVSGGFTKPQSKTEEISDEIVSDIASLGSGGMSLARVLAISAISQMAKQFTGMVSKNEKAPEIAKMGTMFLSSMINPKRTATFVKTLYEDAKSLVPKEAAVASKPLLSEIKSLEKTLAKGGVQPASYGPAKKAASELKTVLSKKTIPVEDLLQAKVNINEELGKIWQTADLDKVGKRTARRELLNVQGVVQKGIKEYGLKNPEFLTKYKAADAAYAAEKSSKKAMDFIKKTSKTLKFSALAGGTELGLILAGQGAYAPAAAVAGIGAFKAGEPLVRFMKDPSWRRYYTKSIVSALNENKAATAKNLAKLNKRTEQLEKTEGK